jgi:hypothetical protein
MDLSNLVLGIFEVFKKTYSIIFTKPYATVKVKYLPQKDGSGTVTNELIEFSIINESFGDIEVQRIWFLTSYNRPVYSEFIDSQMPIKVPENDRATYLVPIEELKAALNRNVSDTIIQAVVCDKAGHKHAGLVDRAVQEQLAK